MAQAGGGKSALALYDAIELGRMARDVAYETINGRIRLPALLFDSIYKSKKELPEMLAHFVAEHPKGRLATPADIAEDREIAAMSKGEIKAEILSQFGSRVDEETENEDQGCENWLIVSMGTVLK
jgi:hypothetical protein